MRVELVQKRPAHHGGGIPVPVHPERSAGRVLRAVVAVDRVGDPGQVGALGEIVPPAPAPDEGVVCQVAGDLVALVDVPREDLAQEGDVLVVPGVAVGQGGSVSDAGDLVAVIPPRQDAGVLGCVVPKPPVGLAVVVHVDGLPILGSALLDDGGVGEPTRDAPRVRVEAGAADEEGKEHNDGHCLDNHLPILG